MGSFCSFCSFLLEELNVELFEERLNHRNKSGQNDADDEDDGVSPSETNGAGAKRDVGGADRVHGVDELKLDANVIDEIEIEEEG
jgi:hypothetical protein